MAKKRPPGARRRGPTARRAEFSMDPASVMHRIESAVPLASVRTEHLDELLGEVREWLHGDWRMTDENGPVKLPENYSLFASPQGMDGTPEARWSVISVYGLPETILDFLHDWIERHPRSVDWGIWSMLDTDLDADEARPVGP